MKIVETWINQEYIRTVGVINTGVKAIYIFADGLSEVEAKKQNLGIWGAVIG